MKGMGLLLLLFCGLSCAPEPVRPATSSSDPKMVSFKTRGMLFQICKALDAFKADCGVYPAQDVGLRSLLKPHGMDKWNGPYLTVDTSGVPSDAWGSAFRYQQEGTGYRLDSAGPDRTFDTEDDLTTEIPRDHSM
jgi:hypothetical protein